MNNEFQRSDNNNGNTVKIVIITILVMVVLGLVVFLVWDKIISKDNDITNNENNNQNNSTEVVALDINSKQVKDLTDLISSEGDYYFRTALFEALDLNNSSRYDAMMLLASSKVSMSEIYEMENSQEDGTFYVDAKKMESKFKEILGPDVNYTNQSINASICGIMSYYNKSKNRYEGISGCGGDELPEVSLELYKAEQKGDEIYTYWYAYSISPSFPDGPDVYVVKSPKGLGKGYTSSKFSEKELAEKEVEKLKIEGGIDTYKITYKKQSDGKYYIYSGEWL